VANPVPPFPEASVPASVTAPVAGEDGVSPVVPALKEIRLKPAIAPVVVRQLVPPCTISTSSVPVREIAAGRFGI